MPFDGNEIFWIIYSFSTLAVVSGALRHKAIKDSSTGTKILTCLIVSMIWLPVFVWSIPYLWSKDL